MVYLKSVENVITLACCFYSVSPSSLFCFEERPRSPCNGNHFSSLGPDFYMYTNVHTFPIRLRALVICDRNSIAMKREEFPARVVVSRSPTLYHIATRGKGLVSHNTWTCANRKYADYVYNFYNNFRTS